MQTNSEHKKLADKKSIFLWLIVLVLVPVTIAAGMLLFNDRKYYIISFLIILYILVGFVLSFEKRKLKARELSVLAALCAIGVMGRTALLMLPQIKPVIAIVVITAVCFGPMSGFLVGAVVAFVSNFFTPQGQGPITPWQMFAFGMIGFLAGVLFEKGILPAKKLPLCIFGGASAFIIYGGIINLGSVLTGASVVNTGVILAAYASGFVFDLIHAAATVFFLLLFAKPMIEKLMRIKTKYGLMS